MKLAYVHAANMAIPSANTLQVARMCEAFASSSADVTLWHPSYASQRARPDWQAHYDLRETLDVHPLPTLLTERLANSRALPALKLVGYARLVARYRAQRQRRPDILYTRCFAAAAFFPRAFHVLFGRDRPRVVFEAHELPPTTTRARALAQVDSIVAITRATADALAEQLGIPRANILVAPDGVPARWIDHSLQIAEARRQLGLDMERPLAVYTGTFQSGTAELLHGIAANEPGVTVLGVGLGAHGARDRVGALPNLSILDPVPAARARTYQAAADVLVMPHDGSLRWSRFTSPLKLFEYMAAGRPIVASHLPVLEEVVRHRRELLLVPLGDAAALATAIRSVLDDPALASRLIAGARETVRAYTWESRARAILDFVVRTGP